MRVAGLFSGIGGLELPFERAGHQTVLLCDNWKPSQQVLAAHFAGVPLIDDVREVGGLDGADVLTAGFPCTDLSQAGRTAGIHGRGSGLVGEVFRLLATDQPTWLVLENVRNMLVLDGGNAMRYLTSQLEELGYWWAYRLVDSRFTGVPQRRHRVLLVASRTEDPTRVLFAEDAGPPPARDADAAVDAYGFYWTEGLRGLGWAIDAIPPMKGGSTVGIPSPPGIWRPDAPIELRLTQPDLASAELLQGFPVGWTDAADTGSRNGPRWKLLGNAVTVGVGDWLVEHLTAPSTPMLASRTLTSSRWPHAAFGGVARSGRRTRRLVAASKWPRRLPYRPLLDLIDDGGALPLSHRAARGFAGRLARSRLRVDEQFRRDVEAYVAETARAAAVA